MKLFIMKYNNIKCYFLFVFFVIILIFSPYTFAPWTKINPPRRPEDGVKKTCSDWILFHGFNTGNDIENEKMASQREVALDSEVFLWAASYAYVLSSLSFSRTFSTMEFCENRGVSDTEVLFLALKDATRTCEGWIYLYRYEKDQNSLNWKIAQNRNFFMDGDISHWATGYAQVLQELEQNDAISPSTFCYEVGITENQPMTFMTRKATQLTCIDWIKLYGFTDNAESNYRKSYREYEEIYMKQIHYWSKEYVTDLSVFGYRIKYCVNNKIVYNAI